MYKGTDLNDRAIDGQGIRPQISHDLPIKKHRQNSHCHVNKEGRKTCHANFLQLLKKLLRQNESERIFFADKMSHHHQKRNHRTDGRRKSRSIDSLITAKYKKIVSEYIEDTAGQNTKGRKSRIFVISQKSCQHLVKKE